MRCLLLLLAGSSLFAQTSEPSTSPRGFTFEEGLQGSVNSLGTVTRLDTAAGYNFSSHVSLAAGIPFYFVTPSASTTSTTRTQSGNGIGNVYARIRLSFSTPVADFASTLTGTAPTGDQSKGFSTGRATVDWSNYFERTISRLTPFADIGIANSVSDTPFFVRPYTTLGFVTHFDGGARFRLARIVNVSASAYTIEPSGQQTVVSRVVHGQQASGATNNRGHGVFETSQSTTGQSDIAKDHGFSTWLNVRPASSFDLYAGYTRSTQYSLDTVFFGVGVSLGKVFKHAGI